MGRRTILDADAPKDLRQDFVDGAGVEAHKAGLADASKAKGRKDKGWDRVFEREVEADVTIERLKPCEIVRTEVGAFERSLPSIEV